MVFCGLVHQRCKTQNTSKNIMSNLKRRFKERSNKRKCIARSLERRHDPENYVDNESVSYDTDMKFLSNSNDCKHIGNTFCDLCLDERTLYDHYEKFEIQTMENYDCITVTCYTQEGNSNNMIYFPYCEDCLHIGVNICEFCVNRRFDFDYIIPSDWSKIHDMELQSSEQVTSSEVKSGDDAEASHETEQVVQFLDESVGNKSGFYRTHDITADIDFTPSAELGEFLKRPVRIHTFTWLESDPIGTAQTISPWRLFFDDPKIKFKLNQYAFLQCDLKVKVLINASPFYYGAMIMAYQPLPSLTPTTIATGSGTNYFIPLSQRPHIWIYPQNSAGGELTLPYFNYKTWIRVQQAVEFSDMGRLNFINYTPLASANGVSGTGVTVQVFAWAENVRLSGPSVGLALQTSEQVENVKGKNDEYGKGPVSMVASAVATFANRLTGIPLISKYATATEMGARALAAGAGAIGYTNVPVINDIQPFKPVATPQLSSSEIGFPVEKLTLDPKNELSIDPTLVGLPATDELNIRYLVQKESFICQFDWSTANVADDVLFYSNVGPFMYATEVGTPITTNLIYQTPMGWLSQMFSHWRGDIIFRFRFIASQYHKGRVRISYDPSCFNGSTTLLSDANSTNAVFTQIVDLGKDSNVEIRIPYQQWTSWLDTRQVNLTTPLWQNTPPFSFTADDGRDNGIITIRCLTALTAPVASSTVPVLVYVRGAENLEFANPTPLDPLMSYLAPQTEEQEEGSEIIQHIIAGSTTHLPAPSRYLANFGENISSLRELLHRSSFWGARMSPTNTTNDISIWKKVFSRFPPQYGYDATGAEIANSLSGGPQAPFNYCKLTPLNWVMPAFIGTRGSIAWYFHLEDTTPIGYIRCFRAPTSVSPYGYPISNANRGSNSANARILLTSTESGASGQVLTHQQTQAGLAIHCPNYTKFRFQSTYLRNGTDFRTIDGMAKERLHLEVSLNPKGIPDVPFVKMWQYVAAGTDFNLHFFLNVPTVYYYNTIPTTT